MIKPISPKEIKIEIPDFVISGINNAILSHFRGKKFTVKQKEIVDEIMKESPAGVTRDELFDKHYLDFEELYQGYGWKVTHDKPAYNDRN